MKSLFPESMNTSSTLSLEGIAGKLAWFELQLRLNHWQTVGFAEHKCTDELNAFVHSFTDEIMEKLMGYTKRRPSNFKIEPLSSYPSTAIVNDMITFASALKAYGEVNGYHDICNLADTFSGEASKGAYLLTLS